MNSLLPVLSPVRAWWANYWCGDGFWISYGVCRIALGLLLRITFVDNGLATTDYYGWLAAHDPADYRQIGILYLLGEACPSAAFLATCQAILKVSLWCVILGLCSRLSLVLTIFCLLVLTSVAWAFSPAWCIGFPVVLLPALAMLLGPPSPLSMDEVLRRRLFRKREVAPEIRRLARAPVLLGQFAVALGFANAGLHKIYLGNLEPFAWVYSDSLRNILISQWWGNNRELPSWLHYVVTHAWAYKGMALANVLTQCAPLFACFFVRRPLLRALFGCAFVLEVIGLTVVMLMPVLPWCLLVVFFIDWDRLSSWFRRRRPVLDLDKQSLPATSKPLGAFWRRALGTWAATFLACHVYVGLFHTEQQRYTYPFTAFPMFSQIFAEEPYEEHRPYRMLQSRWDVDAEPPLSAELVGDLRINYRYVAWSNENIAYTMKAVKERLESTKRQIRRIALERAVYIVPPYPATDVQVFASGPISVIQGSRRRTVVLSSGNSSNALGPCSLWMYAPEFGRAYVRLDYFTTDPKDSHPLKGEWRDGCFYYSRPTNAEMYILVRVVEDNQLATYFGTFLPAVSD